MSNDASGGRPRKKLIAFWGAALMLAALSGVVVSIYLFPHGSSHGARAVRGAFRTGDSHRYALELDTQVHAGGGTLVDYALRGTWVVEVLDVAPESVVLRGHIEHPVLDARGQAATPDVRSRLEQMATLFGKPLIYTLDQRGALWRVGDSDQVDVQVRSMTRAIAAVGQVVVEPGRASWEATERDNVGDYVARYERRDALHLHKKKLRYTSLSAQAASVGGPQGSSAGAGVDISASDIELELRDDGFLLALTATETEQATGATLGGMSTTSRYRLTYQGTDRLAEQALASARTVTPTASSEPNVYKRTGEYSVEADRARIAGRSFGDMMAELDHLPPNESSYSDDDRRRKRLAFVGLAALFRRQPDSVAAAQKLIDEGSRWSSYLWDALGSSGSPEAQSALRALVAEPGFSRNDHLSQLIDLSLVSAPTTETVQFLRDHLNDPEQQEQARYGLGSTAFNLRDEDPGRANTIVTELEQHLENAQSTAERLDYLKALGNTGATEALPTVRAALSSQDPSVRTTAIDSLRHIQSDQVDTLLMTSLAEDQSSSVRRMAASTAGSRPLSDGLAQALVTAWRRDPAEDVRNSAHAAIEQLDQRYPGLLARVEQAYGPL